MKTLRSLIVLGTVSLAFCLGSQAQAARKGPCAQDVQKFCQDVKPGQGRIIKCLREHQSDLSQACKDAHKARRAERKEVRKACKEDVQKFCKDVKPGHGAIMKCMKEHESELSASCKAEREKLRQERRERR